MLFVFLHVIVLLLGFSSSIHGSCPESSEREETRHSAVALTEVTLPGIQFTPSTGKLLTVFQLNNATIHGPTRALVSISSQALAVGYTSGEMEELTSWNTCAFVI